MIQFLISNNVKPELINNKYLGTWEFLARYSKDEYIFLADFFWNNNIKPKKNYLTLHIASAFHHTELTYIR